MILFELLTDRMPYDLEGKLLHESLRVIQEEEPTQLSVLDRTYRGDLDTILSKALEKDKDRRYGSAAELGRDLGRYLANEPILARPPTAAYQLRKFARRNRALVGGLVAALVLLVAGAGSTTYWLLEARHQLGAAEQARTEAEEFIELVDGMLRSARPDVEGRDVLVLEVLDKAAKELEDQGESSVAVARLRRTIGSKPLVITRGDAGALPAERRRGSAMKD